MQPASTSPSPAPGQHDSDLTSRIRSKVAEIAAVADAIPGVVIIHNNSGLNVEYMSKRGLENLGVTLEELIAMGPAYHERFFNLEEAKEYVPKIMGSLERNNENEWVTFFQQVRHADSPDWVWYASCSKIFMRDDAGSPVLSITIAVPLDTAHHNTSKVERLQKENDFLRRNYSKFASLSGRELDVLKLTALGKSANEIAETLFISAATVDTHRKHMKKKLDISSSYEISQYAMAFNLI